MAVWIAGKLKSDLPDQAGRMVSASGSFAAVSTLLGSPLTGAFLMMEATGLGGPTMQMVLIPGLLASGIGYLIFLGLDNLTGFGTFSLAIPSLPAFDGIVVHDLILAIVVGLVAPLLAFVIRQFGWTIRPLIERRVLLATTLAGLLIGLLAVAYSFVTDQSASYILFSGQNELKFLISREASLTSGALLLLILAKSLAYGISLCSFRGGMTFPAMFIGSDWNSGGAFEYHADGGDGGSRNRSDDRRYVENAFHLSPVGHLVYGCRWCGGDAIGHHCRRVVICRYRQTANPGACSSTNASPSTSGKHVGSGAAHF